MGGDTPSPHIQIVLAVTNTIFFFQSSSCKSLFVCFEVNQLPQLKTRNFFFTKHLYFLREKNFKVIHILRLRDFNHMQTECMDYRIVWGYTVKLPVDKQHHL